MGWSAWKNVDATFQVIGEYLSDTTVNIAEILPNNYQDLTSSNFIASLPTSITATALPGGSGTVWSKYNPQNMSYDASTGTLTVSVAKLVVTGSTNNSFTGDTKNITTAVYVHF